MENHNASIASEVLEHLAKTIAARRSADPHHSYTAQLLHTGVNRIGKKIGEEAAELIIAAKDREAEAVVYESADLIFHLMVLLEEQGIVYRDVFVELQRRFAQSGLEEKAQRHKEF